MSIKIVDEDEAERADVLICARKGSPSPFADNQEGVCALCGHAVIFRPYAPRKPMRMCVECLVEKTLARTQ